MVISMNQPDTTLRTVVIDDDELIRKTLVLLLQEYCPDIEVVGEASSFHDAVRNIYDHKPDIVFMDVQLTDTTGFEVLDAFDANDFAVIMMSSYSQFALEAFDYDSKGYLLKPFDVEKLCTAVERARAKLRLLEEVRDYKSRLIEIFEEQATSFCRSNLHLNPSRVAAEPVNWKFTVRLRTTPFGPLFSLIVGAGEPPA